MTTDNGRRVVSEIVGPHRIDLEFPDIVHVHYGGDVELVHFKAFDEVMLAVPPPPLPIYLLRDARHGGLVTAETRAHIANRDTQSRFVAIATYGSSFQTKTVFANMSRALKTIKPSDVPIDFFETEDAARTWIERLQSQRAAPCI